VTWDLDIWNVARQGTTPLLILSPWPRRRGWVVSDHFVAASIGWPQAHHACVAHGFCQVLLAAVCQFILWLLQINYRVSRRGLDVATPSRVVRVLYRKNCT
jgi:hypothetical protein